jgi:hypothetical protein
MILLVADETGHQAEIQTSTHISNWREFWNGNQKQKCKQCILLKLSNITLRRAAGTATEAGNPLEIGTINSKEKKETDILM